MLTRFGFLLLLITAVIARGEDGSKAKRILVHGHRGSRGTHPENTIPAFKEALEAGAEVLELDLQLSKDNFPVIWHDSELSPSICSKSDFSSPLPIRSLSLNDIKAFDCGSKPNPRFPDQVRIPNLRISTLGEFFEWVRSREIAEKYPRIEFNIETKMSGGNPELVPDPEQFVKRVIEEIRTAKLLSRIILQSFDFRTLVAAKKLEPQLRTSALFESPNDFCMEAKKIGAAFISPRFDLLGAEVVAQCHQNGILVAPWTLNSESDWKLASDLGVDAIISDFPRRLKSFLCRST